MFIREHAITLVLLLRRLSLLPSGFEDEKDRVDLALQKLLDSNTISEKSMTSRELRYALAYQISLSDLEVMRTAIRMLEMTLPLGAVFFTQVCVVLYNGMSFFATLTDAHSCATKNVAFNLVIMVLALLGTFFWALFQTPGRFGVRDAVVSSILYLCFVLLSYPALWQCVGLSSAIAYQIVFFIFFGAVVLVVVLTLIARCMYKRALARRTQKQSQSQPLSGRLELDEIN